MHKHDAGRLLERLEPWFETLAALREREDAHALYDPGTRDGQIRMANLKRFFGQLLPWKPTVLLIGEAPGYRGTLLTGINFTSEKIMMGPKDKFGLYGGSEAGFQRIRDTPRLASEAASTVAQRVFQELHEPVFVWPALPMHPHKPGNGQSNRTPTLTELRQYGLPQLQTLIELYQPEHIAALGNIGHKTLSELGIETTKIRHPAHGGGPEFRTGLLELMAEKRG